MSDDFWLPAEVPPPPPPGFAAGTPAPTDGMAITAMVLGIVSFTCCGVLAIPAIVFGALARSRIDRSGGALGGRGMATAGLVLGIVYVAVIGAIFLAVFIVALASGGS